MAERSSPKRSGECSSHSKRANNAFVAQRLEQVPLKNEVEGSSPSRRTKPT